MRFLVAAFLTALLFPTIAHAAVCGANQSVQIQSSGTSALYATGDDLSGTGACENKLDIDQMGGKAVVADPCQTNAHTSATISLNTASTTTLVAGTSGKKTYICSIQLAEPFASPVVGVALVEGAAANCPSVSGGVIGGSTAATGVLGPNSPGFVRGDGLAYIAATSVAGDYICIAFASAVQVSGSIVTVQQ